MLYHAKDLDYNPVDTTGWPGHLICHCCGMTLPNVETGCYATKVQFTSDATVDFHFCSEKCVNDFKKHPMADIMINDLVQRSKRLHGI